ncbi:MAG: tetratricopeptide repeat protein, partial [Chloroflexota bacterium]
LSVGEGENLRAVRWKDVTRIVTADVNLLGMLRRDSSALAVATPRERITITGNTAWYASLSKQICSYLPSTARTINLNYGLLRGFMGVLYALGFLSIIIFVGVGKLAPERLGLTLPGTLYPFAALYPLLFLGLFLPPMWWGIVLPLRIQSAINPKGRLPWWMAGAALALAAARAVTFFSPWAALPDIYPSLAIFIALGSAGLALWNARHLDGKHIYSSGVRLRIALVIALTFGVTGLHAWRELRAYHFLIVGNTERDQGLQAQAAGHSAVAAQWLESAVASYDHVLEAFPGNLGALDSRAIAETQLGQHPSAVADYDAAISYATVAQRVIAPGPMAYELGALRPPLPVSLSQLYASRAIAYESWGAALAGQGQSDEANEKYVLALNSFQQAAQYDPGSADLWLAVGYAYYRLGRYDEAVTAWEKVKP